MKYTQEQIKEAFTNIHIAAVISIKKELNEIQGVKGKEERIKYLEQTLEEMKTIYIPKLD